MTKPIETGVPIDAAITKYMDRRFLSSIDLAGQGVVEMTIDRVEYHKLIRYENGNTEKKAKLLYFRETPKPLSLKTCHINALVAQFKSNKVSDWRGKKVKLHAIEGQFFGRKQLAVRVYEEG